ncbi:p21-C-terminal region-binding protein-domain-containing protein [Xylariomycetidae sp. FL0641]|nr:p21-C-terminal region-binding protein-domain-containing protein [Xylariomycetidae sp. FL0641]
MAKKRAREADGVSAAADTKMAEDSESSDDEDFDMVNVDFEWFNFKADIDFHGTKALLRQLLDVDASLFDISGLADMILGQPTIGSTVKVDGEETDPYAMVTALNATEHRASPAMATLRSYLGEKAGTTEGLQPIADLLASTADQEGVDKKNAPQVGLVLSERLINVPSEIAPPMYNMLIDEVEAAVEDGEPYAFTHYLILSKTYHEIESTLDVEERKAKKGKQEAPLYYFHPEDEVLQKHAAAYGNYPFTKIDDAVADSKRAFQEMGVMPRGSMILIEAAKFPAAVKAVNEYLAPPS